MTIFSWVLEYLFCVCHGYVGLNQIYHDQSEYRWSSRWCIWLQLFLLPLFQWSSLPLKLPSVYSWFYQVFPFTLSSLHGRTNQSGLSIAWVSTITYFHIENGFFSYANVWNRLDFKWFASFTYWTHFKWETNISLLGGLTQTLQKVMLVVRPKTSQTKVFVHFIIFFCFRFITLNYLYRTHLMCIALFSTNFFARFFHTIFIIVK